MSCTSMAADAAPVWSLHEKKVPADFCEELRDRIEWEVVGNSSSSRTSPSSVDIEDAQLLDAVWKYVKDVVPPHIGGCTLHGPHPSMRLLRYEAPMGNDCRQQHSLPNSVHADTPLAWPGAISRLTVLIYANNFNGGSVSFFDLRCSDRETPVEVQPLEGTVLVFDHQVRHSATAVTSGTKRLMKLSVLYSLAREGPVLPVGQACARKTLAEMDEFDELLRQAKLKQDSDHREAAHNKLLDFMVTHDLASWPTEVVTRAFMPIATTLNSSTTTLKLRAYHALQTCEQLHSSELCILLGEALNRDALDADANVRLAALDALLTFGNAVYGDHCDSFRNPLIVKMIESDPSPLVRLRALEGLAAFISDVGKKEAAQARAESAQKLSDVFLHVLQNVSSTSTITPKIVELAEQAIESLSAYLKTESNTGSLLD